MLMLPVIALFLIEILPVIALCLIEMLPVMYDLFSLLNFETTDLFTDNFEVKFFMIFIIYGFLLLFMIQICTAFSGDFKILSQNDFSQSK